VAPDRPIVERIPASELLVSVYAAIAAGSETESTAVPIPQPPPSLPDANTAELSPYTSESPESTTEQDNAQGGESASQTTGAAASAVAVQNSDTSSVSTPSSQTSNGGESEVTESNGESEDLVNQPPAEPALAPAQTLLESNDSTIADSNAVLPENEPVQHGADEQPSTNSTDDAFSLDNETTSGIDNSLPIGSDTADGLADVLADPSITIGSRAGDVIKVLDRLPVSTAQVNIQQSPVDVRNGRLYTVNIEPGVDGDKNGVNLHTVIRQGLQKPDGSWAWQNKLVENRTIHNKWHTAPSVAVDKSGYLHVVYNMHNFPWQYKRSDSPHDIQQFTFRGQAVTLAEIQRTKFENKTTFPTLGLAEIPGNQITYPAFFKDRNDELYLTYRFAARPGRPFAERTMSSGIARYSSETGQWESIGAPVDVSGTDYQFHANAPALPIALAAEEGWTAYHPRLMFGPNNELHVNWFWRSGIAGAELTRPCHLQSNDRDSFFTTSGTYITLPVRPSDCGNLGFDDSEQFYSIGNSTIDSDGSPHILLSPVNGDRQVVYQNIDDGSWQRFDAPHNATAIFFDGNDNLWAIASGIKVLRRSAGSDTWTLLYDEGGTKNCYPKFVLDEDKSTAFIHTQSCDEKTVTIYGVRLQ